VNVISTASVPSAPPMRVSWRQELLALTGLIALPMTVYYLWSCLTFHDGALVLPASWQELGEWLTRLPAPSWQAAALIAGWVTLQVILQIWAPGRVHKGPPLADGSRLNYRTNGWFSFCFSLILLVALAWMGWLPATVAYDHFGALLTVTNLLAFGFAFFLYWYGRSGTAASVASRGFFHDYFMGTGLNPRVREFDFKYFCEARPGLIAWVLINFSFAAKQFQLHGVVTTPIASGMRRRS
jgi:Delta14-sterol reductase